MDFIADNETADKPNRLGYAALKFVQAYLEDGLMGYTSKRLEDAIKGDILNMLTHAGAEAITLKSGTHPITKRPAFLLTFVWGGLNMRIVQVALPTKVKTETALKQSRRQALLNLYESIRMELERRHYQPGLVPFASYILPPGETRTLSEIMASDDIPKLAAPVEGEIL